MNVKYPHQFSSLHRDAITQSKICGCFYCLKQFEPNEIAEWVDKNDNDIGQTVLYPFCEIDSVIGDKSIPITKELLIEMKKYWF